MTRASQSVPRSCVQRAANGTRLRWHPLLPGLHDSNPDAESPDALASLTIQNLPNGQPNAQTTYGYDPVSKRLQTITVNGITFTIAYQTDSVDQIASITTGPAGQANTTLTTTTFSPYGGSADPSQMGANASLLGGIQLTAAGGASLYQATIGGYNLNGQIAGQTVTRTNADASQSTDTLGYAYGTVRTTTRMTPTR